MRERFGVFWCQCKRHYRKEFRIILALIKVCMYMKFRSGFSIQNSWWILLFCSETQSGYTREKIRNLNHHCNDDCNSSLELSDLTHERKFVTWIIIAMMIVNRLKECEFSRGTGLYINTCARKSKGHVSSASQKMIWIILRTHAFSHCDLSETSLEFISGLEFEFVIVISIRDSNLHTHMPKICH